MQFTIGIDEAGRGPWAGPVFAGIVVLTPEQEIILKNHGLNDSKKISPKKRQLLYELILKNSVYAKVKYYSPKDIDEIGIYKSTQNLIKLLALDFSKSDCFYDEVEILIDGIFPMLELKDQNGMVIPHQCIIKGDAKVSAISAASILAKVRRDFFMEELDKKYPDYKFAKHKGYGTKLHLELLKKFGPCEEHRKSFKPVQLLIKE